MSEDKQQQEPQQAAPQAQEPKQDEPANPILTDLAGLKEEFKNLKDNEQKKQDALAEHIKKQQEHALGFFKDEAKKKTLLKSMNQEEAEALLKGIEEGQVTRGELEARYSSAYQRVTGPVEGKQAPVPVVIQPQEHSGKSVDEISADLLAIQRNPMHPYHNPSNPDHLKAVESYKKLDKERDKLVARHQ